MKKRIALLGATGSIGKSSLDVLSRSRDDFELVLMSAHQNRAALEKAAREWPDAALVLSCPDADSSDADSGKKKLLAAIADAGADITINGIAGAAGLEPSLAAIDSGSDLALANKETVVMAGPLVFQRGAEKKAAIIPIDSEHSAIFQLIAAYAADGIKGGKKTALDEIILTASGGPFRKASLDEMKRVTPEQAMSHPTWSMGPKITIDSASLANKGLEVIEAAQFFDMPPEKIKVAIHPQSIVHSMVRLRDGAVYAQLSPPDMRHPIHAALYWPQIAPSSFARLEFDSLTLEFSKPDTVRFPMLALAFSAAKKGGLYPCAYNAANESAVSAFLEGRIGFLDIPAVTSYVLERDWNALCSNNAACGGIEAVQEADCLARSTGLAYIQKLSLRG